MKKNKTKKMVGVKERILLAAGELFLEKGLQGTSVRDITDKAEASSSAISYHFKTKENLFAEIITSLGKEHLAFAKRTLKEPKSLEDFSARLEIFLEELVNIFLENYTQSILLLKESDFSLPSMKEALTVFSEVHSSLATFFEQAQKSGILTNNIPASFIATNILQHFGSEVRNLELRKKRKLESILDTNFRKEWIEHTLQFILYGCLQR